MFALNAVRRAATVVAKPETRIVAARRGMSAYGDIVCTSPTVRISFTEKMVHALILSVGIMGYPIYAMFDVAALRQAEYDELEIPEELNEWKAKHSK